MRNTEGRLGVIRARKTRGSRGGFAAPWKFGQADGSLRGSYFAMRRFLGPFVLRRTWPERSAVPLIYSHHGFPRRFECVA